MRRVIDRAAITDVLMRYARAVDRLDLELLKSVYHPDADDDHGAFKGKGHAFAEWAMQVLSRLHVSQHRIANVLIELEGDIAHVESYFMALHIAGDRQTQVSAWGRYVDRFEQRDGEWKIARRRVVLDWSKQEPAGERYQHEHSFVRQRRNRDDPVYDSG